jgi:hypothetical protein
MINVSPGAHTPGRRRRGCPRRHSAFSEATSQRKFRADPAYPAAWACGNNRLAEIRPDVFATRSATKSATKSKLRARSCRTGRCPASYASMIRFTVLCVTRQRSAALRNCPHPDRRQSHPSVPSRSSMETPSAVPVSTPSPLAAEGPQGLRHDERRVGTLTGHQWGLSHGHGLQGKGGRVGDLQHRPGAASPRRVGGAVRGASRARIRASGRSGKLSVSTPG